jgi:hypothetical protein
MRANTMILLLAFCLCLSACTTPNSPPADPTDALPATLAPTASPTTITIDPTATLLPPNATTAVEQNTVVSATDPACTTLQDLNLRSGPGTAYRPPLRVLPGNSAVTPLGFNPTGIPGGSWVYVQDPANGEKGWVSAGSQYVSCNLELASLPALEVGTPVPPPLPHSALSSTPEGACVDQVEYTCEVVFSDEAWLQFKILKDGQELGQDEGVESVSFDVFNQDQSITYYSIVEKTKDYCIFSGNGPCNPWVKENDQFKWKPGGEAVTAGDYVVNIQATVNGTTLTWHATFTLTVP